MIPIINNYLYLRINSILDLFASVKPISINRFARCNSEFREDEN